MSVIDLHHTLRFVMNGREKFLHERQYFGFSQQMNCAVMTEVCEGNDKKSGTLESKAKEYIIERKSQAKSRYD